MREAHVQHRERLRWAGLAVVAALGLVAAALISTRTGAGRWLDDAVRDWVLNELPGSFRRPLSDIARPLVIVALAPVVVVLALLAFVRRSWRRAIAGVVVPAAATLLALEVRVQDVFGIGDDAFPSNHAAAGLGLLVGVAIVWPRRVTRRGLVALAAAGFGVGLGNVSWYAHLPRDVVGSFLLVVCVTAFVLAVLGGDSPNLADDVTAARPSAKAADDPRPTGARSEGAERAAPSALQEPTERQTRA
jgi:membrane-associated phospholipid phosphatase